MKPPFYVYHGYEATGQGEPRRELVLGQLLEYLHRADLARRREALRRELHDTTSTRLPWRP